MHLKSFVGYFVLACCRLDLALHFSTSHLMNLIRKIDIDVGDETKNVDSVCVRVLICLYANRMNE